MPSYRVESYPFEVMSPEAGSSGQAASRRCLPATAPHERPRRDANYRKAGQDLTTTVSGGAGVWSGSAAATSGAGAPAGITGPGARAAC